MLVEIHALQSFAPSNLNRDDTGSPKDCQYGGYRRARVSSQCWKRAIREYFHTHKSFTPDQLAQRTKRVVTWLSEEMERLRPETSAEDRELVAKNAIGGLKVKLEKDNQTSVLLFLGQDQVTKLAATCVGHWDILKGLAPAVKKGKKKAEADGQQAPEQSKDQSAEAPQILALPNAVGNELSDSLHSSKSIDLALFGRMIAGRDDLKVEAACQVAHAISTHTIAPEFDYYTAVDDRNTADESGAGMIGTIEFNSACYYRYANVNVGELTKTLGEKDLARVGVKGFLEAFLYAIPKAKQNSFGAQNLPAVILIVLRRDGMWSLSNAFVKPVSESRDGVLKQSADRLFAEWQSMARFYGEDQILAAVSASLSGQKEDGGKLKGYETVAQMFKAVDIELQRES